MYLLLSQQVHYVGKLQEICVQKLNCFQPAYDYMQIKFELTPEFECKLTIFINGKPKEFFGTGTTKKSAKQLAAQKSALNL